MYILLFIFTRTSCEDNLFIYYQAGNDEIVSILKRDWNACCTHISGIIWYGFIFTYLFVIMLYRWKLLYRSGAGYTIYIVSSKHNATSYGTLVRNSAKWMYIYYFFVVNLFACILCLFKDIIIVSRSGKYGTALFSLFTVCFDKSSSKLFKCNWSVLSMQV